jgi:ATP-dependent Clp protease ATP-binding subunit ClpC
MLFRFEAVRSAQDKKYLEDEMAEMIIRATVSEGDTILVDFDKEEQKITTQIKKEKE